MKNLTILKKTGLLIIAFLMMYGLANATTYYVSENDSSDDYNGLYPSYEGGINGPFETINKGADSVQSGDTLYIRGGTYNEIVYIAHNGDDNNPIVISAYPGETVVIDGEYLIPDYLWGRLVSIKGEYVIFKNIEVTRSAWMGVVASADHVTIQNVYSHHNYENGILFSARDSLTNSAHYGLVEGCVVSYNNQEWIQGDIHNDDNWSSGLSMQHGGSYGIIRNNTVYENGGEGLSVFTYDCDLPTDNVLVEGNTVYNNWHPNIYLQNTRNTVVQRNLVYNTRTGDETVSGGIQMQNEIDCLYNDNNMIINNFIMNASYGNIVRWACFDGGGFTNCTIAHNTSINAIGKANILIEEGGGASGSKIYNNIFVQDDSLPIAFVPAGYAEWSHNLWSKTPDPDASGEGDKIGDPGIVKEGPTGAGMLTPEYFKLLPGSPAMDSAISLAEVTDDFFGTFRGLNPDIGGYEYVQTLDFEPPAVPQNLRIVE